MAYLVCRQCSYGVNCFLRHQLPFLFYPFVMKAADNTAKQKPAYLDLDRVIPPPTGLTVIPGALSLEKVTPESVNALYEFVARLECRLAVLSNTWNPANKIAREFIVVLEKLVLAETGGTDFEKGLPELFDRLYAPAGIREMCLAGLQEAKKVLEKTGTGEVRHLVSHAKGILEWYLKQKACFLDSDFCSLVANNQDGVAGARVITGQSFCGLSAFGVEAGMHLSSHPGETLWFKVFVKKENVLVNCHKKAELWQDKTGFVGRSDTGGPFCALHPIGGNAGQKIMAKMSLAIPLAALDLSLGEHDLSLDMGIYASSGERLFGAQLPYRCNILEEVFSSIEDEKIVPSPQALSIWPQDLATGTSISFLHPSVFSRSFNGKRESVLEAKYKTVSFVEKEGPVRVKVELLDEDLRKIQIGEGSGPLQKDLEIGKSGLVDEGVFAIPLSNLELPSEKRKLFVELSLVSGPEQKTLAGALASVVGAY